MDHCLLPCRHGLHGVVHQVLVVHEAIHPLPLLKGVAHEHGSARCKWGGTHPGRLDHVRGGGGEEVTEEVGAHGREANPLHEGLEVVSKVALWVEGPPKLVDEDLWGPQVHGEEWVRMAEVMEEEGHQAWGHL